MDIQRDPVVTM